MLEAAVAGGVAGYAIAIPVGAIAVLIIQTGLAAGFRTGAAAAAGAATADGIYALLAAIAGLAVTTLIGGFLLPLRIVGGGVLIAIGLRGFLYLRSARESVAPAAGRRQIHRGPGRTYLALLALTLLNPATVIYFTALTVGLPFLGGVAERMVFAVAAFAASLSWQLLLAAFGAALNRGFGDRVRRPTVLIGNAVVTAMGVLIVLGALQPSA